MDKLREKKFVVTGASSGLGLALARRLLKLGALVAVCSRNQNELRALYENYGDRVIYSRVDLAKPSTVELFSSLVLGKWDWVDAVVNNASTLGVRRLKDLADSTYGELEKAVRVNYLGAFKLISVFLPSMLARRSGIIVNITSDVAAHPEAGWGAYAASKAALECMTKILAKELDGFRIRVNLYDPGDMNTKLHKQALPEDDPSSLLSPEKSAEALLRILLNEDVTSSGKRLSVYQLGGEGGNE
jgi:NAD(P)-dependent dehydrogenase (short-subunit alcohol dehydrogenase family)